jgi:hypothetical protein
MAATSMNKQKRMRIALFFSQSNANSSLSYQHGWPRAFVKSTLFSCIPLNLASLTIADYFYVSQVLSSGALDAVVLLHSVFSNQQLLRGPLLWALAACRIPKVFFIGNEYKLMPEKIRFCRVLDISLLITQSNDTRVMSLYSAALGCNVASIPNTGVDLTIFCPMVSNDKRPIDIGYRSYPSAWYLGNNEKTQIAEYFTRNAKHYGLKTDISLSPQDRFNAQGYALFLNRCRGQIGTEPGGDYFELSDTTRKLVNNYIASHPDVTWPVIKSLFFDSYGYSVPMRIISGRQVEAAACKSVQILMEGRYNDYFQSDVHYIPLAKDFSNSYDVIEKFRDKVFCQKLVDNAYDVVIESLTYERLLASFLQSLKNVI